GDDRNDAHRLVTSAFPTGPRPSPGWDHEFIRGLGEAVRNLSCPLLGGDTVSLPADAPRVMTLTAIGRAAASPVRSGAKVGNGLYVTGTIGDAGAGLRIARGEPGPTALLDRYRRPHPRLAEGRALAPIVSAMMDVSDGLLIDAARMAEVSGLGVAIDLDRVPLSAAYRAFAGDDRAARIAAVTAGDDYELLFAAPVDLALPVPAKRIGTFVAGAGLSLTDHGTPLPLPEKLGFLHGN
ncbi:MAG: thiamine-phosphate kinase, partial [Sphingomonas sp.]